MIENIPAELHPVLNQIAWELYRLRGYEARENYDFSKATHPHEIQAWKGAIVSLCILQEFCLDNFGLDLSNIIDKE